MISTTRCWFYP